MGKATYWSNSDGLYVGFGPRTVQTTSGAALSAGGARQQVVVNIKATDIADTSVVNQLIHGVVIPANALLETARLFVTTAFAGTNAVMDIGTYLQSAGTAVDDDGIDSAIATATLVDNVVIACDGALVGTVLASNQIIGVTYDTAAFTAGEAFLVVEFIPDQIGS